MMQTRFWTSTGTSAPPRFHPQQIAMRMEQHAFLTTAAVKLEIGDILSVSVKLQHTFQPVRRKSEKPATVCMGGGLFD
jgi:hypothetical protein